MLSEIYTKNVKIKNKDGSFSYEPRTFVRVKAKRDKAPKVPKWVNKLVKNPTKMKSNLRVTPTEWELMELQKKRRDLNNDCGAKRKILETEYQEFYKKYPYKKPEIKKPRKSDKAEVPCSNDRFSVCEAVVFTYPNGNRKIITTEKLPAVKKEKKQQQTKKKKKFKKTKGVSDGCRCRI